MGGNVTARWSNETIDFEDRNPLELASVRAAEEDADGIFRVWSNSEPQQWTVARTETAEAASIAWDASSDDPRLRCIAPGMVDAMASPYPIELAQESDDIIVIRMEEWDGVRRIQMNTPDSTENFLPTPLGYSVGHWEGNTLVVSTNRSRRLLTWVAESNALRTRTTGWVSISILKLSAPLLRWVSPSSLTL